MLPMMPAAAVRAADWRRAGAAAGVAAEAADVLTPHPNSARWQLRNGGHFSARRNRHVRRKIRKLRLQINAGNRVRMSGNRKQTGRSVLARDLRQDLPGDRLGACDPRIARCNHLLEVGLGVGEVALAEVDLAALEPRARVVGLA